MTVTHRDMANAIRFLSMDAIERQKAGHPGAPLGLADVATVLFTQFLRFDAADPLWPDRDRFVLSVGHGSMLLYSLLYLTGYKSMDIEQIKAFRHLGSHTSGHPEYAPSVGIEMTTGPLGQGVATAVGMALAERMMREEFGKEAADHFTYVLAGDGCLMEGVVHEAVSLAGHFGLGKLIVIWDDNRMIAGGSIEKVFSEDYLARYRAAAWDTFEADGHNPDSIAQALRAARESDRPSLVRCRTTLGWGAPTKAGTQVMHGHPMGEEEVAAARVALGWPHAPFDIPQDILDAWRQAGQRGASDHRAWAKRMEKMPAAWRGEFDRRLAGTLPADWPTAVARAKEAAAEKRPTCPTTRSSGDALNALARQIPEMVSLCADLEGVLYVVPDPVQPVTPTDFSGRHIPCGVREHAMAAAANGVALHGGFRVHCGTYLVFSDYLKPSLRLSAMMDQPVVYVLGDDSIGVGNNGPTHQPVEHLAGLRAIPNLSVFRPADAMEVAECWELALRRTDGPSAIVLTKQPVSMVREDASAANRCGRGAYVLAEATGKRAATLLATGSEVAIALAARQALEKEGIPTAVVSMPCWELFDEQEESYRRSVLGEGTVRVGIEAAVGLGWDRYLGPQGTFIGMKTFGAAAVADVLFRHFGISAENVVEAVKRLRAGAGAPGARA